MRLNRANASMRDQERLQDTAGSGNVQEQACLSMWRELVGEFLRCSSSPLLRAIGNWTRRTKLVKYCVYVVDQSLTEHRKVMEDQTEDPASQRRIQAKIFEDEVKVWTE
jgi:hypothetical protein